MNKLAMTLSTGKTDLLYREQWEAISSAADRLANKYSAYTVFSEPLQVREDLITYAVLGLMLGCEYQDSYCETIEQRAIEIAIEEMYNYVDSNITDDLFSTTDAYDNGEINTYITKITHALTILVTGYVYLLWEGLKINKELIGRLGASNDIEIGRVGKPIVKDALDFNQFVTPSLSTYIVFCGEN